MTLLHVAWRGWLIVFLTSMNVSAIAGRHWLLAFCGGFAISLVWWDNVGATLRSVSHAREAYAFGAAVGTITAMLIVWALYG